MLVPHQFPHDIASYLPLRISDDQKQRVIQLAQEIAGRIESRLPAVISYQGSTRVVSPHSLYLQHRNLPSYASDIRRGKKYPWNTQFHTEGARRTIAMDAYQVAQNGSKSLTGWRTFHLDKVDEHRLLSFDEIVAKFLGKDEDPRSLENYLSTPFPLSSRFIKYYNHGVRLFLSQTDAQRNNLPGVVS